MLPEGRVVRLRFSFIKDRRMVWEWAVKSDISKWLMCEKKKYTYRTFCRHWKKFHFDGSLPEMGRILIIEINNCPVGSIAYNAFDKTHKRSEIDIWLGGEKHCGKGYGSEAIYLLTEYLFKEFNLKEVWAQPSQKNERSVKAFKKAGFIEIEWKTKREFSVYGTMDSDDSMILSKKQIILNKKACKSEKL